MVKLLIIISVLIPLNCIADVDKIFEENRITLKTEFPYKSTWTPTTEQIDKALNSIYKYIDNPQNINDWQKEEIKKIKKNISEYKVQFIGIGTGKKKRIWCNFFRGKHFKYWKQRVVVVKDGGFWFWQIEYNLNNDKCINFRSNGYA